MRIGLLLMGVFLIVSATQAQHKIAGKELKKDSSANCLKEVVVTGEYQPQSLRNSVYRTRILNSESIRLRAATNVQQVLNTELGFRFSNDMTLGTSDVMLMGMSGRNVKILLDGVPMIDRGDTRESLNQIDINSIERIEIVEGPLSVSYGTDALAGVLNMITKKAAKESFNINARVQEETVGDEYSPFGKKGAHLQHAGASWQSNGWSVLGGVTHNDFNGFNSAPALATSAEIAADINRWKPKAQWLGNARLGYHSDQLNVWYRMDYADETILSKGGYNPNNFKSVHQKYITNRYTQQLQGDYKLTDRLQLSGVLGYANLNRTTRSVRHDYSTGKEELSDGAGEQDISKFQSTSIRATAQYRLSDQLSFQPGIAVNLDGSSGARIKGDPSINDYAFFISAEWKVTDGITIRPGARFIKNSVYDAPPVIPSLNTKFRLNKDFDLRLGYASGFRSPALRELYYDFVDASHSILGNENLKAEQSHSFSGSLTFTKSDQENSGFRSVVSGFYNTFSNRIDFGLSASDPTITTLINVSRYKTTGGTFENTLTISDLQISLGLSYIGINNRYVADAPKLGESDEFAWTPELNSSITYSFSKIGTTVNLVYKFSGRRPFYQLNKLNGIDQVSLERTGAYSAADLMINKKIAKSLHLNAGVKNLFDITTISSTSVATGSAHSTGGPIPLNYGRSYVVGLSYNWNKN
jgi:outer membrane receptor for ferrienterochelin and colicins